MGHCVLSINILWERCCDLDPKTSVSVDESRNGGRLSAALKRKNVTGPIFLEFMSFGRSFTIRRPWSFSGEGPTLAGGFVRYDRLYARISIGSSF